MTNLILFIIVLAVPMSLWTKTLLLIILGLDLIFPFVTANDANNIHIFTINFIKKKDAKVEESKND